MSSHFQDHPLLEDQAMQKRCIRTHYLQRGHSRGMGFLEITVSPFSGWPASLSEPLSCPLSGPAVGYSLSAPPGDSSRENTGQIVQIGREQRGKKMKGILQRWWKHCLPGWGAGRKALKRAQRGEHGAD